MKVGEGGKMDYMDYMDCMDTMEGRRIDKNVNPQASKG